MSNTISTNSTALQPKVESNKRFDVMQEITNTIIKQLEAGTIPWRQSWLDKTKPLHMPKNAITGNRYNGTNILLLWCSANDQKFTSNEWASFKQWNSKNETVRKGEKGSMIVYADTYEKEIDGQIEKFQFLKTSKVFNRCQLASYKEDENLPTQQKLSSVEKIERFDDFVANTFAEIVHHEGSPYFSPSLNKIYMPHRASFHDTENCTATENYYSTLAHELIHWAWASTGRDKNYKEKYGANQAYAIEELIAELGAAFLTCQFEITNLDTQYNAAYIASWLKALKDNKTYLITAASEANRAICVMEDKQPLKF